MFDDRKCCFLNPVAVSIFATHIYRIAKRSEGIDSTDFSHPFEEGSVDRNFGLEENVEENVESMYGLSPISDSLYLNDPLAI
jgi:hypothetical protein